MSPQGGKAPILNDVPRKAAEHLKQNPGDWVFALPDLYPMARYDGTPSEHRSFAELSRLLQDRFASRADRAACAQQFASFAREFRAIAGGGDPDPPAPARGKQRAVADAARGDEVAGSPDAQGRAPGTREDAG
ncbi:hypothetical protein [Sorangium sp. So ce1097]|uniref:hypothetical protein n=1 Tax=Sorangium sp. So ce1097 TaxID=3133330 RepID=UPI003F5DE319